MAIINNNVENVKFLRNGSLFANHDVAYETLTGFTLTTEQDGTLILARYGSGNDVKTLAGLVYVNGENKSITIIDVEASSSSVEELRQEINAKLGNGISSANTATAQLIALSGDSATDTSATTSVEGAKKYADNLISTLDGGVTAETGYYVKSVSEVDGKISGTTEALPTVEAISEAGKAITAVSESNGTISASAGNIDAQYVDVTGFTATDVQGALEELDDKIDSTISGLDYSDTAVPGEYVSEVDEVDGVISVTRVALPSVTGQSEAKKVVIAVSEDKGTVSDTKGTISSSAKTIVLNDNEDGGIDFDVNIDGVTLEKDANGVISVTSSALVQYEGDTKTIAISPVEDGVRTVSTLLTLSSVTPSSTTVKEEYALKNASGETIGSTIKIYKDSSLVSIELVNEDPTQDPPKAGQFLKYTYIDASGATQSVYVDVSALLVEAEFESGVTANDAGVVHGVVDPTSESFLTVGENGFKISGVSGLVENAIDALDADKSGSTEHVSVRVEEVDGKITAVTVTEDDIASDSDLTQEISDREDADEELSNRLGDGVTTANTATAQLTALSGNGSSTSAETSVEGAKRYADAKLAEVVADLDATVSGESTHVNVEVSEENGVITAVTVVENNIANADDLATLSGKTITNIKSTNSSIDVSTANTADGTVEVDAITDASKIKMSGFTADTEDTAFSAITTDKSVAEAANVIVEEILANEEVVAEALNDLRTDIDTVSGDVDTIKAQYISGVSVNGNAVTVANHVAPISVSSATSAMTPTSTEAIVVDTDTTTGAITIGLGTIDCGTY